MSSSWINPVGHAELADSSEALEQRAVQHDDFQWKEYDRAPDRVIEFFARTRGSRLLLELLNILA